MSSFFLKYGREAKDRVDWSANCRLHNANSMSCQRKKKRQKEICINGREKSDRWEEKEIREKEESCSRYET